MFIQGLGDRTRLLVCAPEVRNFRRALHPDRTRWRAHGGTELFASVARETLLRCSCLGASAWSSRGKGVSRRDLCLAQRFWPTEDEGGSSNHLCLESYVPGCIWSCSVFQRLEKRVQPPCDTRAGHGLKREAKFGPHSPNRQDGTTVVLLPCRVLGSRASSSSRGVDSFHYVPWQWSFS